MSNICRFTVPASRDIESIIDYVAGNSSLGAAERLLNKINQKCRTLANFPIMGAGVMSFCHRYGAFQLMST